MAQWPVIYNRLITWLPGVTGVRVYDGPALSGDTDPVFITVGFVRDAEGAGGFAQERDGSGYATGETGDIFCELYAGNGDNDLPAARAAAFAVSDAIEAALLADQTLGVLRQDSTIDLTTTVGAVEDTSGAYQWLALTFHYVATH